MAIREVLKFPDPRLREVAKPVKEFDASLKKLSEDMFETMYAENGIGLAAPQVAELKRMLVIDCRPRDTKGRYEIEEQSESEKSVVQPLVLCNPKIVKFEGSTTFDEGCLSVPSFYETVERHKYVEVEYQDVTGEKKLLKTDGLLAIVIQHEMDHLEGTLFIDHLSLIKANKIKNQIKKHGYPAKKSEDTVDEEETIKL
jgi:peptide deformylase